MIQLVVPLLLWASVLGFGLMAGVYFAFSTFVMAALRSLPAPQGAAAMNAIDTAILRSPFMPLFWGTTLAGLALAAIGLVCWRIPGAPTMLAGGIIYVAGMFAVTAALNVPLNNELASAGPDLSVWERYLRDWTFWNHVRTLASAAACALSIAALLTFGAAGR